MLLHTYKDHTDNINMLCQLYLQNTTTQELLNHVMLLHTHKDHTDNINLLEIAKEFVSFNDRQIHFLVIFDV